MKTIFLCLIGLLSTQASNAQSIEDNFQLLRTELAQKVNALRIDMGARPLRFDDVLKAAAVFHSNYMAKNDTLTHQETAADVATPQLRVLKKGGHNFELVGENVLYSRPQHFPLDDNDVKILAEEMFLAWKKSPGHYANMIKPEYELGDFGFQVHPGKKIVYATQVFGKKGVSIPGQLSSNAYGLTPAPLECNLAFREFPNLIASMGNDLRMEGSEIKFYYYDIGYFKRIFQGPNDGIAVDLVSEDQLLCGQPNQLDISPVYDGVLLKPVYRDELLRNNEAKSDVRVITVVGHIPTGMNTAVLSPSLILVQDGKKCRYLSPATVPHKYYALRPIKPVAKDPGDISLLQNGIVASQQVEYEFNTNQIKPVHPPVILPEDARIVAVEINAYSSVEGDSLKNDRLHQDRALYIQKHIQSQTHAPDSVFSVSASENWPFLGFQLAYYGNEKLAAISHDSIKKLIASGDRSLPWEEMLYDQRTSTATIHFQGTMPNEGLQQEEMNLRTAVLNNDVRLANKALYLMSLRDSLDTEVLFEKAVFDWCCQHPEVSTNTSAVLSRVYRNDLYLVARFLFNWAGKSALLEQDARFNMLHLYTLVGQELLDDWDTDSERLSRIIHPKKVDQLTQSTSISQSLMLNLHLTYLQYYGQINDAQNINQSFNFINQYFREHRLNAEDDIALVLFFNYWSMYDMTIDYLLPKYRRNELDEEGVFILAQTMNLYEQEHNKEEYLKILDSASRIHPARWCNWLQHDFQMLRDSDVKSMYCHTCQESAQD